MPQCSPCFLLFLCFRKATQEIFSELDETKAEPPIFLKHHEVRRWDGGGPEPGHTLRRRSPGPGRASRGWDRLVHLLTPALPPIYSPQQEKPKCPINFPRNILQAAAVVDARSGGSRTSFRYPTGEGNHRRRPSLPPWVPPEWCVSSLPWTTSP
jgi:hypothetical protein